MGHRVTELYSIMPIANIASVMVHGILSNEKAKSLKHTDISNPYVQSRRDGEVPRGLKLHQYANLYFCPRNPMLFYLKSNSQENKVCILRVSKNILRIENVVVTDQNAASIDYVRFFAPLEGLRCIDFNVVFSEDWRDTNINEYFRKKSAKCAEILVPHCVESKFILGAYVANEIGKKNLVETGFQLPIEKNGHLFFNGDEVQK